MTLSELRLIQGSLTRLERQAVCWGNGVHELATSGVAAWGRLGRMDALDPSLPAFYLPGQKLEGGNMRAFAAMAPCQPDGGACESGSD
jgi:hypothetical protein